MANPPSWLPSEHLCVAQITHAANSVATVRHMAHEWTSLRRAG